jgi:hypothetical protein
LENNEENVKPWKKYQLGNNEKNDARTLEKVSVGKQ